MQNLQIVMIKSFLSIFLDRNILVNQLNHLIVVTYQIVFIINKLKYLIQLTITVCSSLANLLIYLLDTNKSL